MAGRTETYYPPYTGGEPYIHLCFSDRDERKIRPLLRRLLRRGCRVWYHVGEAGDRDAQLFRSRRMLGAGLTVLYLTEAARRDTALKNRLLLCQKRQQPVLVLNTDGGDSSLSLGLTMETAVAITGESASDVCDAILHGSGFSQDYMGEPQPVHDRLWQRRISLVLLLLSLLLGAGIGVYRYLQPPAAVLPAQAPQPEDAVLITDEYLRETVRTAIGGGPITEESLEQVDTLRLSQLPSDADELALFPRLSTLILSQAAAKDAPAQPALYERYTLIVAGGEAQ